MHALRNVDALLCNGIVVQLAEVALPGAQVVHALPVAPALQCHVDVLPLLFGRGIGMFVHVVVAAHGGLAALHQVLIFVDERVDALDVLRLVQRLHLVGLFLAKQHVSGQQGGAAVAHLHVCVAHDVVALGLVCNDAEQVVVEELAVNSFHHEGVVVGGLHPCQLLGVGQSLGVVVAANVFMSVLVQPAVFHVDMTQHAVVDGLQGGVAAGLSLALLQPFHHGSQRVGADVAQRLGPLQLGLQQLSVGLLLLGFLYNLGQYLLLGLWQVFLAGFLHLFPQVAVGLSIRHHGQ